MSEKNRFHLSVSAAENYDTQKVPAIFGPMAEATLDAIDLPTSADVLDIACGTGVVARAVASRLSPPSRIAGADLNPVMVEIARQRTPAGEISFDWHAAPADDLPFEDGQFDLVFCQQGLQFFPDRPGALTEIRRVLRPGGRLFVTCWAAVPPFFEVVAGVLRRRLGEDAAAKTVEPFVWNDSGLIGGLISAAGFEVQPARRLTVQRRMPATHAAIRADILATPNEPELRAAGVCVIESVVQEVFEGVSHFIDGGMFRSPQETYLFEAVAY